MKSTLKQWSTSINQVELVVALKTRVKASMNGLACIASFESKHFAIRRVHGDINVEKKNSHIKSVLINHLTRAFKEKQKA